MAFVIVDLEGTASRMILYAMSRADLVIIPTRGSVLDAVEAVAAVREVRQQEEAFGIKIPSAVLLTCTSAAIRTRTLSSIEDELKANQVPIFNVRLHDREAFRSLFAFGGTLRGLDPKAVRNISSAIESGQAFAEEVVARLRAAREEIAAWKNVPASSRRLRGWQTSATSSLKLRLLHDPAWTRLIRRVPAAGSGVGRPV